MLYLCGVNNKTMKDFKLLSGENNEHIVIINTGIPKMELRYKIISEDDKDDIQFSSMCIGDCLYTEVTELGIEVVTSNLIRRFGNAEYLGSN